MSLMEALMQDALTPATEAELFEIMTSPQVGDPMSPMDHVIDNMMHCNVPGTDTPLMTKLMSAVFAGGTNKTTTSTGGSAFD